MIESVSRYGFIELIIYSVKQGLPTGMIDQDEMCVMVSGRVYRIGY